MTKLKVALKTLLETIIHGNNLSSFLRQSFKLTKISYFLPSICKFLSNLLQSRFLWWICARGAEATSICGRRGKLHFDALISLCQVFVQYLSSMGILILIKFKICIRACSQVVFKNLAFFRRFYPLK